MRAHSADHRAVVIREKLGCPHIGEQLTMILCQQRLHLIQEGNGTSDNADLPGSGMIRILRCGRVISNF